MSWLIGGIVLLVIGYLTYGRFIEWILGPDDRKTPAYANADGVDYLPMPKWKNMMIQLLNIAGTGPVIGVIIGIKFGKMALLIIPVGCILMGAVHDFVSGMISLRMNGANLPKIITSTLGRGYAAIFSWAMLILLLLVVAVFINVPSDLIDKCWIPNAQFFWPAVGLIFVYYIVATLFPVDAIIGRVYPLFSIALLVGTLAILGVLLWNGLMDPSILEEGEEFLKYRNDVFDANGRSPLFPLLFVTIACGIISGFHSTQSPIVARTMKSEHEARPTFYGMMIAEGVIAMVWASAALAIYNLKPENLGMKPAVVLGNIASYMLGDFMGGIAVLAVVVLAITSGDTALRSARLSLSEMLNFTQIKLSNRIVVCVPLMIVVSAFIWWSSLSPKTFNHLWNYFAFGNQVISATTLMACTVWLLRQGKGMKCLVTLIPGLFMTTVVTSFILWTSSDKGQPWGLVPGGLPLPWAIALGVATAFAFAAFAIHRAFCRGKDGEAA